MMLNSKSIGNKIVAARKKMNLSQTELAQRVFISSQAVGKWERGESMPDIPTLNQLAQIFGVDLNYFSDSFSASEPLKEDETIENQPNEKQVVRPNKRFGLNWNMSSGNWVGADFSGLNNLKEKFSASNIKNCKFIGADLSELVLKGNNIEDSDFSNSDLRDSKIQSSNLCNNLFNGCSIIDATFNESEIDNCSFNAADFSGVEFSSVNFEKNKIENAIWKLSSFYLSNIADIEFNGIIEECSFESCSFSKVTFKNAKLLNTFFKGKKLMGIKFIDCEADRMTYEFLKNAKADLSGLSLIA